VTAPADVARYTQRIDLSADVGNGVYMGTLAHGLGPIPGADSISDGHSWRVSVENSDTQLQQDVLTELKWEPSMNAAQIGVEVNGGVFTLAGHVNTHAEKWDAERATQRVPGVKALAVEMNVKRS
jgi:hypothetical protein